MAQKNFKASLLAAGLALVVSACTVGGDATATGENDDLIATDPDSSELASPTTSEDNSLSLGFRVQGGDAAEGPDETFIFNQGTTTTNAEGTTTTSTSSLATTTDLRSPTTTIRSFETTATTSTFRATATTSAPTTARPIITAAPTTARPIITAAPTTARPIVTAAPTTAEVITIGATAQPVIEAASARLKDGEVVVRSLIYCHESWREVDVLVEVLRNGTVASDETTIECINGEASLRRISPSGDQRVIIGGISEGTTLSPLSYQVRITATSATNSRLSTSRTSDSFVTFDVQDANDGAGDGWEYFGVPG